jgi:glucosamine 6-phosphate synthetase-like amidotransferase/phosphosugar isomerase protein
MQALNYAKQQGALCVGVTNTVGSAIATATDCGIHVNAGCEIGVASTKAYTSQIVAITLLALVMAEDSVSRKRKYDAVVSALRHLPDSVRQVGTRHGRQAQHTAGAAERWTRIALLLTVELLILMQSSRSWSATRLTVRTNRR